MTNVTKSLWIILLFFLTPTCGEHPPGHLQPLGSQLPAVGEVPTINEVPSPEEFFREYAQPGKPVLFKGAAKKFPAYSLWTDDYLSTKYGHLMVDVEEGKKENRSKELFNMPLSQFLEIYNKKDVYLVYSLPKVMRDEVGLLKSILCGGFTDSIQDSVMWFSNGGTKSVLHFDAIENINCLMSGSKELFMVDKKESAHIDIDSPEGSFSKVDVDKVDLSKYPGLADVPWYHGKMESGDCLFIPYRWFHQVRSFGPRNLAINIWFSRRLTFNSTDCDNSPLKNKDFAPLSAFDVAQSHHQSMRSVLVDEMEHKSVDLDKWMEIWKNSFFANIRDGRDATREEIDLVKRIFHAMDTNKDSLVTPEEATHSPVGEDERHLTDLFHSENNEDDEEDERPEEEDERQRDHESEDEETEDEERGSFGAQVEREDL